MRDAGLEKYGVEVEHRPNGLVDVTRTFLNALDVVTAIEDPSQRAAAGTAIFGKSWMHVVERLR